MKRLLLSILLSISVLAGFSQVIAPVNPYMLSNHNQFYPLTFIEPSTGNIWIRTQTEWRQMVDSVQWKRHLGASSWGNITGTLTNQTDLVGALSAKQNSVTLTTVGSSGTAAFNSTTGVLNIPNYVASWGSITGTLSTQTDLQSALSAKQGSLTLTNTGSSGAASLIGNTLNIPTYTPGIWGSITGTLSSQTDLQSALNTKQNSITLTTTGTSGVATLVGSTLNIPNYAIGSAAWGSISGTLSSQSDLNTALSGKQGTITLTTTGASGASTLIGNTLNIPTYNAISTFTTTGTSGASSYSLGTLNIPTYQGAITLTTTGSTGAATFVSNTLNIPNYSTGVALLASANTFTANNTFLNFYTTSAAPTIAVGAGAGTGATCSINGNNQAGVITLTTGTGPTTSSVQVTITMSGAYAFPTKCVPVISPAAIATATSLSQAQSVTAYGTSTTSFAVYSGTTALAATTTYQWNYHNMGY